ncbi:hypothetical protein AB0I00_13630 [Streptomyces sp. NPDC050803]|uniref:hypothetical protein n=1 Tax=unclassified Streptomyces TaxID=2593676 RepID=UPI00342939A1
MQQTPLVEGTRGRWSFARHYLEMVVAMVLEHLAMLPLMLVVMLRRRAEYGG